MLQQNIDKFVKWAQTWQLSLSSQKCSHMRIGLLAANNPVDYCDSGLDSIGILTIIDGT